MIPALFIILLLCLVVVGLEVLYKTGKVLVAAFILFCHAVAWGLLRLGAWVVDPRR